MDEISPEMMSSPGFMAMLKAMMDREGVGAMRQEVGAYDALGADGFRAHSNLGTVDERSRLAAQDSQAQQQMVMSQLEQMQKASEPQNRNYGSVAGNILGGVGDIARQVGGAYASNKLMGKQADLAKQGMAAQTGFLDQKDAGRLASGNAEMSAKRKILDALISQKQQPTAGAQGGFGLQGLQFDPSLPSQQPAIPGLAQAQPRRRLGPSGIPLPDPSFYGF